MKCYFVYLSCTRHIEKKKDHPQDYLEGEGRGSNYLLIDLPIYLSMYL